MKTSAACLFGGALFAAGVAGPTADAQSIVFQYSGAVVYATVANPGPGDPAYVEAYSDAYGHILGFGSFTDSAGDMTTAATASPTGVTLTHARGSTDDYAYSYAAAYAYFIPTRDVTATLSWDATGWDSAYSYAYVFDVTTETSVVDVDATPPGSMTVPLVTSHRYVVFLGIGGTVPEPGAFVRLDVPEACTADLDANGVLNVDDIDAFVAAFLAGCG